MKTMSNFSLQNKVSAEMNEIFENLEEGIVVLKNNTVNYTNKIFNNILKNL